MFQNRLSEKFVKNGVNATPKSRKYIPEESWTNERRWAVIGLFFSLLVVFGKLYYGNYEAIQNIILERKLVSYTVITENGQVMFTNSWKTAVRFSKFWLPILCGFLTTYFTWMCVYLDSSVPGVNPPSPLSPQKIRIQSGHTFHLNYVFAVLLGLLVTSFMYLKGVSIQY